MKYITARQKSILDYIKSHFDEFGHAPTVREVSSHFGITIGPAQKHLRALVRKGYLRHTPGLSRGIDIAGRRPLSAVPVLGRVMAGIPDRPGESAEGHVYVESGILSGGEHFALKVRGDSMTGSGIFENDTLIVRKQPVADDGDIVVAMVDGEGAVKRFRKKDGHIFLESTNPKYKPIRAPVIIILGKVVHLSRKIQ